MFLVYHKFKDSSTIHEVSTWYKDVFELLKALRDQLSNINAIILWSCNCTLLLSAPHQLHERLWFEKVYIVHNCDYMIIKKRRGMNIYIFQIGANMSPPVIMVSIYLRIYVIFNFTWMKRCYSICTVFNGLNCTSSLIWIVQPMQHWNKPHNMACEK